MMKKMTSTTTGRKAVFLLTSYSVSLIVCCQGWYDDLVPLQSPPRGVRVLLCSSLSGAVSGVPVLEQPSPLRTTVYPGRV